MKFITLMVPVTIECNCAEIDVPPRKTLRRRVEEVVAHKLRLRVSAGACFDAERKFTYSVGLEIDDAR